MKALHTSIDGVLLLEPTVFGDERGFFMESFNQKTFNGVIGHQVTFVQDNHSRSKRGVLRGLHYQLPPHAQGKLVRVSQGSAFDVAVDLRRSSPTYGKWVGFELSGENQRQLWLPPGMAHGFYVISESADFLYKTTDFYNSSTERCILWNDPLLGIAWPDLGVDPVISAKDAAGVAFVESEAFP
jgi:dTDP-4-dehydrorhamnose 3,5-epimerase